MTPRIFACPCLGSAVQLVLGDALSSPLRKSGNVARVDRQRCASGSVDFAQHSGISSTKNPPTENLVGVRCPNTLTSECLSGCLDFPACNNASVPCGFAPGAPQNYQSLAEFYAHAANMIDGSPQRRSDQHRTQIRNTGETS